MDRDIPWRGVQAARDLHPVENQEQGPLLFGGGPTQLQGVVKTDHREYQGEPSFAAGPAAAHNNQGDQAGGCGCGKARQPGTLEKHEDGDAMPGDGVENHLEDLAESATGQNHHPDRGQVPVHVKPPAATGRKPEPGVAMWPGCRATAAPGCPDRRDHVRP